MSPADRPNPSTTLPATRAQKDYAESLGISFTEGITRTEISKLIDEAIERRRDRIDDMDRREGDAYEKLREEIIQELDAESPRLCNASHTQMIEELTNRGRMAILLQFDGDAMDLIESGAGEAANIQISFTEDLTESDMRKALGFIGTTILLQDNP